MIKEPSPQAAQTLLALLHDGRHAECEKAAINLLERFPQFGQGWKILGVAQQMQGHLAQAFRPLLRAAELLPQDSEAQGNLGLALLEADEPVAALRCLQIALDLNPADANAWNNMGHGLCRLGRLEEAEAYLRKALALLPEAADFLYNLGSILHDQGRMEEAISEYQHALAQAPLFAHAHWSLGMALLQGGDFAQGWKEYEWRWQLPSFMALRAHYQGMRWTGEQPVAGKTLLLYAEQGLGDSIQFCRYATALSELGARVILHVPAALTRLMRSLPGSIEVMDQAQDVPAHDMHCPLMSLPLAFQNAQVPLPPVQPYLFADAELVEKWQCRLGPRSLPRVGICWRGNRGHKHDYRRSIALDQMLMLADESHELVCLHEKLSTEETGKLDNHAHCRRFDGELSDFADSAALIAQLDLVITVDTAIAHLAGAMGKPTWLLLSAQADWRWMEGRADSPWYQDVRMFRQATAGNWLTVIVEIQKQIQPAFAQLDMEQANLSGISPPH